MSHNKDALKKGNGETQALMSGSIDEYMSGSGGEFLPDNITGQTRMPLSGYNEQVCGTEKDLDENAYGCCAVALVREGAKIALELEKDGIRTLTVVRLTCSVGIMVVNLILQFAILKYISSYVVEPAVHEVQRNYQGFHAENFDADGELNSDTWDAFYKADVCQITMADASFYFLIILLWTLRILDELRKIHRFVDEVTSIRGCTLAKDMVEYTDTSDAELGGRCLITHLTPAMRWTLLIVVFLPRALIAMYLLCLGCRWLSASENFTDMVLNALALVFVTDIDELLYESVLPHSLKQQIADTNWFFIEDPKTKKQVEETEWMLYRRTAVWMIASAAFIVLYGMYVQSVLPFAKLHEISHHCSAWKLAHATPLCKFMGFEGSHGECYPFGVGS